MHDHHVIYRQHLRIYGGSERDERNLIPLCGRCHANHHAAVARLPVSLLPSSVHEFAAELGLEWIIDRYYGVRDAA